MKREIKLKKRKKHSIFRMFLIPLIAVMLLQGLLTLGTLIGRQSFRLIRDYSVNMMSRTVENRKVILENDMTQRWVSVSEQRFDINSKLEDFLAGRRITVGQLLESEKLRQEFLETIFPGCLEELQNNLTSGIFVILTGQDGQPEAGYEGFFIRDSDPVSRSVNYTDMLLERGNKRLSRAFNIPLDTCWTTDFHMDRQRKSDRFFYEPWRAAEENPDADMGDLGYWSAPFVLEDDPQDSHEMITYSLPLRYDDKVYGVLGIEVSLSHLYDYFPLTELNDASKSGYMLAVENSDGSYSTIAGKGVLYNRIAVYGRDFALRGTEDNGLYRVEGIKLDQQNIYAVNCPLKLFDSYAPYDNTKWVLLGLNTENALFGMYRQLYMWVVTAILAGLLFGILGIYFSVRHLTKPIQKLMGCISRGHAGLESFQPSNILEVDKLYDVVVDLTRKQKETEDILLEEKERYRVALESSSDTFFSYDIQKQTVDVVNYPPLNGRWQCGAAEFIDLARIYQEDRPLIERLLRDLPERISVELRLWNDEKQAYQWRELYGNTISDPEGNRLKLVGAVRNIQEQKERELAQKARMERDSVTGLYVYAAGRERLTQCRREHPQGVMVYLYDRC